MYRTGLLAGLLLATALPLAANAASAAARTAQQQRMADCSAKNKGLKGDAYKQAQRSCLTPPWRTGYNGSPGGDARDGSPYRHRRRHPAAAYGQLQHRCQQQASDRRCPQDLHERLPAQPLITVRAQPTRAEPAGSARFDQHTDCPPQLQLTLPANAPSTRSLHVRYQSAPFHRVPPGPSRTAGRG